MVRHLGQITDEIIEGWSDQFEKRNGGYFCQKCASQIRQVIYYVSIHLKDFEPICGGPGMVKKLNYPFCPQCDAGLEYVTACYHVNLGEIPTFPIPTFSLG